MTVLGRRQRSRFIPADPLAVLDGGRPSRYVSGERLEEGLVISLDGIGGYNWLPRLMRRGLDRGGVRAAIVIYHWSVGPLGLWVTDLFAADRNRAVATDLAQTIAAYRDRFPDRPVTLIGHSGGGALAAWALEALPDGCQVDRALLLAPALSPRYNLAPAVRGVRDRLFVSHSWGDFALMGLGTMLFGTIDRRHTPSAGWVGLRLPRALSPDDRQAYGKVRRIRWHPRMIADGHIGDHVGWTVPRFARRFLAPIVLGRSDPGRPLVP